VQRGRTSFCGPTRKLVRGPKTGSGEKVGHQDEKLLGRAHRTTTGHAASLPLKLRKSRTWGEKARKNPQCVYVPARRREARRRKKEGTFTEVGTKTEMEATEVATERNKRPAETRTRCARPPTSFFWERKALRTYPRGENDEHASRKQRIVIITQHREMGTMSE